MIKSSWIEREKKNKDKKDDSLIYIEYSLICAHTYLTQRKRRKDNNWMYMYVYKCMHTQKHKVYAC